MLSFAEAHSYPDVLTPPQVLPGLIGDSPRMHALAGEIHRAAKLPVPVVLRGESGTGKELLARALHASSRRADGPFVAVNAAGLTRDLVASELFGHRRGSFTGAHVDRKGALREAHGGTLLLDEVGSLSPDVQPHLLRVLENGSVRPVGGDVDVPVDVRFVSATCEPLELMVRSGRFRADLYERLAGVVIEIPPLRERTSDLPHLARHLLRQLGLPHRIRQRAIDALSTQTLLGNVRQLKNVLAHAALVSEADVIEERHVRTALAAREPRLGPATPRRRRPASDEAKRALDASAGNITEASRRLGVPRTSLRRALGLV
jgi:DNA-binding NtrC family response regulator